LLRRGFVPSTEHQKRRSGRLLHRKREDAKGKPRSEGWCGQPRSGNSARMIAGWRGWTAGLGRSGKRGDEPLARRKRQGPEEQESRVAILAGIAVSPDPSTKAVRLPCRHVLALGTRSPMEDDRSPKRTRHRPSCLRRAPCPMSIGRVWSYAIHAAGRPEPSAAVVIPARGF
jgi:hypothetical protein